MRALLLSLLLSLAIAPKPPHFVAVPNWPKTGQTIPGYGTNEVVGVAVGKDEVYVVQKTFPAVLVFGKDGTYHRSWGDGMTLRHTCRLDPDGNVWVTGIYDHQVAKFTPDGQLLQIWGERDVPGDDAANHFNGPSDVAFGKDGTVYISDGYGNSRIVHLAHDGTYLGQWGSFGKKWGQFNLPHSVAVDADGNVYVADRTNLRIQVFTAAGRFLRGWKTGWRPYSLFVNQDGQLCVSSDKLFAVYTLTGKRLNLTPIPGAKIAHMVSADTNGDVYFTNLDAFRVQKYARQ